MHPDQQKILALIENNRIHDAFKELSRLQIRTHTLAQLRQEFEVGIQTVNFIQRFNMAVDSVFSDLPQTTVPISPLNTDSHLSPTTPHNTIEAYIALLTKLLEEIKSSRHPESSTLDIPVPPVLQGYEKIIGNRPTLININWLRKGLLASQSVCRVVLPNEENGTGFVMEGGYLLTNYHVIEGVKKVAEAKIEFNFEEDAEGKAQKITTYELDTKDCKFSPKEALDYAYVKIKDDPQNPLSQWGTLTIEDSDRDPEVGQPTIIIQHPSSEEYPYGGIKKIAFENNEILSVWKQYLFYKTDTLPGSSGAPVLNKDWKVIALHHFGLDKKQGGMKINDEDKRVPANRGVLMKDIMNDLKNQLPS